MKTVTAKEFQRNSSKVMKEAAKGTVVQITHHGRPWVELRPGAKSAERAHAGSPQAFRESLDFTYPETSLPNKPDYKAIRRHNLEK
jgi:prevent-host-death family protein